MYPKTYANTVQSGKQILPPKPGYRLLIIQSDMNAFFTLGDNFILLLALQIW